MTTQADKTPHFRRVDNRSKYFKCSQCGKRLIGRRDNGVWYFRFGRQKDEEGNFMGEAPVEIYIYGSVKIKCLRRECSHWNTLDFFPFNFFEVSSKEKLDMPKK